MRKNRIRLTESDLHRIVNESVRRILREGQGFNRFNTYLYNLRMPKDMFDSYYGDDFSDENQSKFIKYGDENYKPGSRVNDEYYDEAGYPAHHREGWAGRIHKPINRGLTGRIGRWAGMNAAKGLAKLRYGLTKRGFGPGYHE